MRTARPDVRERFRLATLALALGVEPRVAQRARGLCAHRQKEIGVVVRERIATNARNSEHCHEAKPNAERNREQRPHGRRRTDDQRVGTNQLRRCRVWLGDQNGLPSSRNARDHTIA